MTLPHTTVPHMTPACLARVRAMTAGRTTRCVSCRAGRNQICAPCLFSRYRESILDALADATWQCLVCRGMCSCSLCRAKEG
ncbi:unnamed protein product [Closterium sp. Yama58-4]|nr:unnamed protein product [Closterium sp. Yama58-4]